MEPLAALQAAFAARQLLTYFEDDALVVNDPYLRERVVVYTNQRWLVWCTASGRRVFREFGKETEVVDAVVQDYAGIYLPSGRHSK